MINIESNNNINNISQEILHGLLDIHAIIINTEKPFTWASGIKSPIYCDNRKTIGHYLLRRRIAEGLSELIKKNYPEANLIGGTATAGIPHATSTADILQLPLIYFRSKAKDHGTGSLIEGDFKKGQKIVIVEDLISTGGSVLKCVEEAKKEGLIVLGVAAIFSYQLEKGIHNFKDISLYTLTNFIELEKLLIKKNKLTSNQQKFLEKWRKDPENSGIWN